MRVPTKLTYIYKRAKQKEHTKPTSTPPGKQNDKRSLHLRGNRFSGGKANRTWNKKRKALIKEVIQLCPIIFILFG